MLFWSGRKDWVAVTQGHRPSDRGRQPRWEWQQEEEAPTAAPGQEREEEMARWAAMAAAAAAAATAAVAPAAAPPKAAAGPPATATTQHGGATSIGAAAAAGAAPDGLWREVVRRQTAGVLDVASLLDALPRLELMMTILREIYANENHN